MQKHKNPMECLTAKAPEKFTETQKEKKVSSSSRIIFRGKNSLLNFGGAPVLFCTPGHTEIGTSSTTWVADGMVIYQANESCYRAKLYPQRTVKDTVKCNAGCKLLYWKQAAKQDMHSVWVTNSLTAPVAALGKVGIPFLSLDWKRAEKNIRSYQISTARDGTFHCKCSFWSQHNPPSFAVKFRRLHHTQQCLPFCMTRPPRCVCVCVLICQNERYEQKSASQLFFERAYNDKKNYQPAPHSLNTEMGRTCVRH